MFISAYDTTAGKKIHSDAVDRTVLDYVTLNVNADNSQLIIGDRGEGIDKFYRLLPGSAKIETFSQPLVLKTTTGQYAYVVDVRPFTRITNPVNMDFDVTSIEKYESLLERMLLQISWVERGPSRLLGLGILPMRMYAMWVTSSIAKRTGIDADTQMMISVLASYFYYCLHLDSDEEKLDRIEMANVSGIIRQATGADLMSISTILSELPTLRNIDGFIEAVKLKSQSARIASLNAEGLYVLIATGSSSHDPRVTNAVALEHPPTFVGILSTMLRFKGAMRSQIGELLKPISTGQEARAFKSALAGIISEFNVKRTDEK